MRSSGILLHPTSLPSPFGIGDLGDDAYRFVDFLELSGQRLWQILPLGPTGYGNSPYSSYSAFAGNTLLISPERLARSGLLTEGDFRVVPPFDDERVDFEEVASFKKSLLLNAYRRFKQLQHPQIANAFTKFSSEERYWLDDYALFQSLKDANGGSAWTEWDSALVKRDDGALTDARQIFASEIEAQKFYQFLFFQQWAELKSYCAQHGVRIIGDIPIFVAHDSADVWTNPDHFKLDTNGLPTVVSGVPPDYFSETGQLWGNPLYNWQRMASDGFGWWIKRVSATLKTVDLVRIDHFRGFAACWEIPAGDQTAERGQWVAAPGIQLFQAIRKALGEAPIIAEDLGVITPDVEKLRDDFGFPGMRVLQFGFGDAKASNVSLPHNYPNNVVAYTGTHDNDTTAGWFKGLQLENEREFCLDYLNSDGKEIYWDFIRAVLASVAQTTIIPLQDVLGVGSEARMNLPNSKEGNWRWRYRNGALSDDLAKELRRLTELYGR
jgi:4-alpha-glucanotransferase